MKLGELIAGLGFEIQCGRAETAIRDLTDDSRQVVPGQGSGPSSCGGGFLFIARRGTKADGVAFVEDAFSRGAVAVLSEAEAPAGLAAGVAWVRGQGLDQATVSRLAERFFGQPSRRLKLIGITGTKGKTTTAFLVQHLLAAAGGKCGMIGTIWIDDGSQRRAAQLTTPGAADFSRYLAAMVSHGCGAAVAEVSSHALDQGRTAALDFDGAVFTNLTGDHLDYHETMQAYAQAKARLFAGLRDEAWAVANADDEWAKQVVGGRAQRLWQRTIWYSLADERQAAQGARAEILEMTQRGSRVIFKGPWGQFEARLPLVGRHNVYNALAAAAAAWAAAGLAAEGLREGLASAPAVPGRLEPVAVEGAEKLPTVLVDYAHTHDALRNVLSAMRPFTRGKLVVVFGCGGDRDRSKRPKMAAVACGLADRVWITSDNPRTEEPAAIIREILAGVAAGDSKVIVDADRAKAIAAAIAEAGPDDVVLIAGKGHEDYQIVGTTKRHFDDREEAATALRRKQEMAAGKRLIR